MATLTTEDWDEHSKILEAVIDGDKDLAPMLATRHVHRAVGRHSLLRSTGVVGLRFS